MQVNSYPKQVIPKMWITWGKSTDNFLNSQNENYCIYTDMRSGEDMNILITAHNAPFSEENKTRLIEAAGNENIQFLSRISDNSEYSSFLPEADVVIGNLSAEELNKAVRLRFLQSTNAGVDSYTENPEFPKSLLLTNASGAFGGIISEYILGGILALYRRLPQYLEQKKEGVWKSAGSEFSLEEKTALILGCGDIGTQTAKRLKAFGVNTVGIRKDVTKPSHYFDRICPISELEQALPEADLVIGCLPRTKETVHLLNRERLFLLKEQALVVNVGRGTLIDTAALTQMLQEGRLYGAVLDVTDPEPLPQDHPLWKQENVIITPHISGISFGHAKHVENIIADICCENLRAFRENRPLRNIVAGGRQ